MVKQLTDYKIDLALMKADIISLKTSVASIDSKLDKVIESKADKADLDDLKKRVDKDNNLLLDVILRWGPIIAVVAYTVLGKVI